MIRDFINYNSETFIKTIELMKKHGLSSLYYDERVSSDEYEDEDFYEDAIEICNRLCDECNYFVTKEEAYEAIEDVINYWHGNSAKDNVELKSKIRGFGDDLLKFCEKKQKKNEKDYKQNNSGFYKDGFFIQDEYDMELYHDWALSVGLE